MEQANTGMACATTHVVQFTFYVMILSFQVFPHGWHLKSEGESASCIAGAPSVQSATIEPVKPAERYPVIGANPGEYI